ncbi:MULTISPECIES: vWA domain-containing protein [Salinibaculum]|uniref:vWA domain-containing protein n=1 Tax=Salinibaculum TaxID=2732368 RepID=UPI0030CF70AE
MTHTTDTTETANYPVSRRSVLRSTAALGTFSLVGGTYGFANVARADEHTDGRIETCGGDLDIVLALDYSGSIGSALWDDIETGAKSFIDVLNDDNQLGVVTFGDTAKAYDFGTGDYLLLAQDGGTDNRPTLKSVVPTVAPPNENGTHMAAALDFADDILDGQGRDGKEVIILLTDGSPNYQNGTVGDAAAPPEDEADGTVGNVSGYVPTDTVDFDPEGDGANTYTYSGGSTGTDATITQSELDETEGVATDAKSDGTRIIAVGIGGGVNDAFLKQVASSEDDYVQTDAESIGATLQGILSEVCDECAECDVEGRLAKYEFDCVETVDDECVAYDFVLEAGDSSLVSYAADSFTSKDGEMYEPMSATFGTEYCTLYAVVKAGRDTTVQAVTAADGMVTVTAPDKFALSFVEFYCDEEAATAAAGAFPGGKGGRGRR